MRRIGSDFTLQAAWPRSFRPKCANVSISSATFSLWRRWDYRKACRILRRAGRRVRP